MDDDKEPPFIDLHPSQWERKDHPQPFFGESGKLVLAMFLLGVPITYAVSAIVHAAIAEFGQWTGLAVAGAVLIPCIFLIGPALNRALDLLDYLRQLLRRQ